MSKWYAPLLLVLPCFAATLRAAPDESPSNDSVGVLIGVLAENQDPDFQLDVLKGMNAAMEGRQKVAPPPEWRAVREKLFNSKSAPVRQQAQALGVVFGDEAAFDALRKTLADKRVDSEERIAALNALLAAKDAKLTKVLHGLLEDLAVREAAINALSAYDDAATPALLLSRYKQFDLVTRRAALGTLAGRLEYARQLVSAVNAGKVPVKDLTAATARQLRDLGDPSIDAFVDQHWGVARTTAQDKVEAIEKFKALLTDARVAAADASHGRAVFARTCSQCHTLYGEGGQVGPDLTGSNRFNLDYVLQNVIDPSAVIAKEFQVTLVRTKDGRVVSGIAAETDHAIKVVSETGTVVVPWDQVDKVKRSDLSMMPDGLISSLSEQDMADLVAYLRTKDQVPLPPGARAEKASATAR
jgi:putative heme-binding domain-containing protein